MAGASGLRQALGWADLTGSGFRPRLRKCTFVVTTSQNINAGATTYYTTAGQYRSPSGTYVINGAGALAMTLATPTLAQDGATLTIIAGTAHAHTGDYGCEQDRAQQGCRDLRRGRDYSPPCRRSTGLWYNIAIGSPTQQSLARCSHARIRRKRREVLGRQGGKAPVKRRMPPCRTMKTL